MIHPSYVELMKVVNNNVEIGEEPVVNSRYSIVIAAAKRARQIIDGAEPLIAKPKCNKPLSCRSYAQGTVFSNLERRIDFYDITLRCCNI